MTTLSYPSERFPAPPSVSLDIPESWEPLSVPSVVLAARQREQNADFTPNVIVRMGTRPGLDQPADALMELAGSMQGREDAVVGELQRLHLHDDRRLHPRRAGCIHRGDLVGER